MKFWQKIFLCAMLLFTVAFDVGAYVLVTGSYKEMIQQEMNNSIREQAVIASAMQSNIANVEEILAVNPNNEDILYTLVESLAQYYKGQNVTLKLYKDSFSVFNNMPDLDTDWLKVLGDEAQVSQSMEIEGVRYIFVVSRVPGFSDLTLVYARDISGLELSVDHSAKRLVLVSMGALLLFCGIIFILIKRLTKPIYKLVATTSKIAAGDYKERVIIERNDEIGELSEVFNHMASSVEENVMKLTEQSLNRQIFIDDLAHEMKTPMTSILGYTSLIMKANLNEEQREQAASYIYSSAKRLSLLSEKLLELANLSANQVESEEISVPELLEDLKIQMELSLQEREISLVTKHALPSFYSDKALIMSLIINLVENSARASEKGKTITVSIYKETETIIEVKDEGCGMKESEISKIMQPFYKLDKARTRKNGGAGLGLSIVQRIIEVLGGSILIESKVGVGTKIKIILQDDNKSLTS